MQSEADIEAGKSTAASSTDLDRLVVRVLRGDARAFRLVYDELAGRVHGLVFRILADRLSAEEATQDAFVRAWVKRDTLKDPSRFEPWIKRIAVNSALQLMRHSRKNVRLASRGVPEEFIGFAADVSNNGQSIDLDRAIHGLPDRCRTVFVLHDVEGYRHREIASMMGIAVGTSKAQLFQARQRLRKALQS